MMLAMTCRSLVATAPLKKGPLSQKTRPVFCFSFVQFSFCMDYSLSTLCKVVFHTLFYLLHSEEFSINAATRNLISTPAQLKTLHLVPDEFGVSFKTLFTKIDLLESYKSTRSYKLSDGETRLFATPHVDFRMHKSKAQMDSRTTTMKVITT